MIGGGLAAEGLGDVGSVGMDAAMDVSNLTVEAVPQVGLPTVTTVGVQLNPNAANTVQTTVAVPPPDPNNPLAAPAINAASLQFLNVTNGAQTPPLTPVIELDGQRFTANDPRFPGGPGSSFSDLKVDFIVAGKKYPGQILSQLCKDLGGGQQKLYVLPPTSVAVGQATIQVERPINSYQAAQFSTVLNTTTTYLLSNQVVLSPSGNYVFAADAVGDVAVINNQLVGQPGAEPLLARIPIHIPGGLPKSVALTPDLTRVYVIAPTFQGRGGVAVVDAMAFQQIDALPADPSDPRSRPTPWIDLGPGSNPFWAAASPRGDYLFVSDYSTTAGARPRQCEGD
jgi:hypothetical protein